MNKSTTLVGLFGAIVLAPLTVGAQQHLVISYGESYVGPSNFDDSRGLADPLRESIPYGYLWNGYCEENARHYACRMQHALDAAAVARNAAGACPAEKWNLLLERIGSVFNSRECLPCPHEPTVTGCGDCLDSPDHGDAIEPSPVQPLQPEYSPFPESGTDRASQEPIRLMPAESAPRRLTPEPSTTNSPLRSPIVRLAPAAPQPSRMMPSNTQSPQRSEHRIPRNVIPRIPNNENPRIPRNEIPSRTGHRRSAALTVQTR
jgi:hypothetical protein